MFGLIDGNNFYVSCERAFDPRIVGKPVVKLSNNDGCAIARSADAKALGVKMGEVWHLSKRKPKFRTSSRSRPTMLCMAHEPPRIRGSV